MRRVVVTGMAGLSPLGCDWAAIEAKFRAGESGLTRCALYEKYPALKTKLAGEVKEGALPPHYDRKRLRGMSRGALLAVRATEIALEQAGLAHGFDRSSGQTGVHELARYSRRAGVAYGSCLGGAEMLMRLGSAWDRRDTRGVLASSYTQVLSHCCAANISLFFQIRGRMIPTCSACTSGSQAIGYSFETIRNGLQDIMIAGGAEEICVALTGLFDALGAASPSTASPIDAPRPFDAERDGLIVSEGAATLVLEELEHARSRGAKVLGEVVGFATNCDGTHLTNPQVEHMTQVMRESLTSAGVPPGEIGFVHAHATGTDLGDVAESRATAEVFGERVPITATKSFQGHTLGATAAFEAWFSLEMLARGWVAPIRGLRRVDPRCADLDYITSTGRAIDSEYVVVNNFAFGGVNTSLVFRRM